jgi:hypothetical protein
MVVVVAVLNLIVLHILTLVCPAGVCCSCSRRLGPPHADALLLGACWPHPWMLWHMMVLLCGRMLCRRCRLGPLACRCFAAVSVLAPSADALPRRWSLCLGRVLLPVFRPPLMQMLGCCERVGPIRGCFAASMVFVLGRKLCRLEFLADALPLLASTAPLHC